MHVDNLVTDLASSKLYLTHSVHTLVKIASSYSIYFTFNIFSLWDCDRLGIQEVIFLGSGNQISGYGARDDVLTVLARARSRHL